MTRLEYLADIEASKAIVKSWSGPDVYDGPQISALLSDIAKSGYEGFTEQMIADLARIIPAYHAPDLIKEYGFRFTKGMMSDFFNEFCKKYPDLVHHLKKNLGLHSR